MQKTKNQHYVPQFYLRNFSNDTKSIGMYRYEQSNFILNASIQKIASEEYLYGEDGELEKMLAHFEADCSNIFKDIFNNNTIDINKFKAFKKIILYFISISDARILRKANLQNTLDKHFKELFNDAQKRGYRLALNKNDFLLGKKAPNLKPIKVAIDMIDYYQDLEFVFIVNKSDRLYITSDAPTILYNQLYVERSYKINYGIGAAGLQIFIILNPRLCLCFYDSEVYDCFSTNYIIQIKQGKQVDEMNKLIVMNSYEQIFLNNKMTENYIRYLAGFRIAKQDQRFVTQYYDSDGKVLLIRSSEHRIHEKINLNNFFRVKEKFKTIPLPNNFGGLIRTHVKILEMKERINKAKSER